MMSETVARTFVTVAASEGHEMVDMVAAPLVVDTAAASVGTDAWLLAHGGLA